MLKAELARNETERLCFGRIILTGCILRPDFDWATIKAAGLVDEVMNHGGNGGFSGSLRARDHLGFRPFR